MGDNEFALRCVRDRESEKLTQFVAWLLGAAKGYGVKVVNPGGVSVWKGRGGNVTGLDDAVEPSGVTPRRILEALAQAVDDLGLPHALHVHTANLGVAGNWATTLDTMRALDGRRAHLAHVQFHSYGGEPGGLPSSRVAELADYLGRHPNLSVDVGQVVFGDTTSMTGDGPVGRYLHGVTRRKWLNADVELESGSGIVPIEYRRASHVHTTQWAIGLEWLLLMDDLWRIALSTDHPNGGTFLAYPEIIQLLMDREARREACRAVNQKALGLTRLPELDREYSLYDVATVTRAAPARLLGLSGKGHLGVGADADITVYDDHGPWDRTFSRPRLVLKSGEIVAKDGELLGATRGRTLYVEPAWDRAIEGELRAWFRDFYTVGFDGYPVDLARLSRAERVATRA
jgi:formylmethanofuran dehydrogenase subunit A